MMTKEKEIYTKYIFFYVLNKNLLRKAHKVEKKLRYHNAGVIGVFREDERMIRICN